MTRNEWARLILAAAISPSVPILTLAITYSQSSGSNAWFPFLFLFGYLFFCLFGLPVVGILVNKKTLSSCIIGGGCTAIAPVLLLDLLSGGSGSTADNLRGYLQLFVMGCLGGVLFWLIAFAKLSEIKAAFTEKRNTK